MRGDSSLFQDVASQKDNLLPAMITDIGCEREINEDRYAVLEGDGLTMWVVCDGMGGALGGELAAQLAIDTLKRTLQASSFNSPKDALAQAIEEANRIIVLRRQNPTFGSMGTTIVGAVIRGDELVLSHVGDSRAYLIRQGNIQQLTADHTYVQDLVDKGLIKPEEALSHPQAHVLTKCLEAETRLDLDIQQYWVWKNSTSIKDKLVFCTDGLYNLVSDEEIASSVSTLQSEEACAHLVELARNRGGFDNITIAIFPLDGELKSEMPDVPRPQFVSLRALERSRKEVQELPLANRLVIMFILAMIGSVMTTLLVIWQMSIA